MENKPYRTIAARTSAEFTERRSSFLGYLAPCATEQEALAFLEEIRAEHRKATHNVYAYRLREGNTTRYSDDGEPQGTAAVPILDVLIKRELVDVCCVVTRYFGGILLGGGGLVRAYSHVASLAVDSARILHMTPCVTLTLRCSYTLYGRVASLLSEHGVQTMASDFAEEVTLSLLVAAERLAVFEAAAVDTTNGQVSLCVTDELYADMME